MYQPSTRFSISMPQEVARSAGNWKRKLRTRNGASIAVEESGGIGRSGPVAEPGGSILIAHASPARCVVVPAPPVRFRSMRRPQRGDDRKTGNAVMRFAYGPWRPGVALAAGSDRRRRFPGTVDVAPNPDKAENGFRRHDGSHSIPGCGQAAPRANWAATRGDPPMSIRSTILSQFEQVADEQGKTLAPLTDATMLLDSGLDSLCFAIIVARLEDQLSLDPFQTAPED